MLKPPALAPMPIASVSTDAIVKPGDFQSWRNAYRTSWIKFGIKRCIEAPFEAAVEEQDDFNQDVPQSASQSKPFKTD
jgi:hypothetical protein